MSVESLQHLKVLFSSHWKWLQSIPLLVISERMCDIAISYSFNYVMMAGESYGNSHYRNIAKTDTLI
ncbi:hypothetical protein [Coxiella-like endosymbiont]|uniref:hypothetical protein n=1 Tax=Coxiella-like endosymbiont TaxID=1592897 RepID=UPI00272DC1EF|nr:hypothetical protein [Coxiella-like endosymbiont]